MKKSMLTLGKVLRKNEQQQVMAGSNGCNNPPNPSFCIENVGCITDCDCCEWEYCLIVPYSGGGMGICN